MFNILLQAASKGMDWGSFIFFPLIIIVFYFFMIRPQQKKTKDQKVFRESIKKGDTIVTVGGLHGKIASLESDDTFILEVDKGIRLKFEKSAISLDASKKYQTENKA